MHWASSSARRPIYIIIIRKQENKRPATKNETQGAKNVRINPSAARRDCAAATARAIEPITNNLLIGELRHTSTRRRARNNVLHPAARKRHRGEKSAGRKKRITSEINENRTISSRCTACLARDRFTLPLTARDTREEGAQRSPHRWQMCHNGSTDKKLACESLVSCHQSLRTSFPPLPRPLSRFQPCICIYISLLD